MDTAMEARAPNNRNKGNRHNPPPSSSSNPFPSSSSNPASSVSEISSGPSSWPASSSSSPAMATTSVPYHGTGYVPIPMRHNTTITIHDEKTTTLLPSRTSFPDHLRANHDSLSTGGLAAAIVVPILVVFSMLVLAGCLCRRRALSRKSNQDDAASLTSETSSATLAEPAPSPAIVVVPPGAVRFSRAAVKRQFNSLRSSRRSSRAPPPAFSSNRTSTSTAQYAPQQQPPMTEAPTNPTLLTANQNHSYFTGLDTWSQASSTRGVSGEYDTLEADNPRISAGGTTYLDPPPPYSVPASTDPPPLGVEAARSPFEDPDNVVMDGFVADGFSPVERQSTIASVGPMSTHSDSTLYSGTVVTGERRLSDPFRNPDDEEGGSPTDSIVSLEWGRRDG